MKPLIISSDDYGLSAAIDAGILDLIRQGRLTATSCLSMSPDWPNAAQLLTADIRQQADIGLHLDFTQYGSYRFSLLPLILRSASHSLSAEKIRASIHQQLDCFEKHAISIPDYVDGHQHVHQLPQIREALLSILTQRYGGTRPWLRVSRPLRSDGYKGRIISRLGADALVMQARKTGFAHTSRLLGVYNFKQQPSAYLAHMHSWLDMTRNSTGVDALMCHPARVLDTAAQATACQHASQDPIYAARLQEYQLLSGQDFAGLLQQYGILLSRGSQLFKAA